MLLRQPWENAGEPGGQHRAIDTAQDLLGRSAVPHEEKCSSNARDAPAKIGCGLMGVPREHPAAAGARTDRVEYVVRGVGHEAVGRRHLAAEDVPMPGDLTRSVTPTGLWPIASLRTAVGTS